MKLIATKSAEGYPRDCSVYTMELAGNTFGATNVDGKSQRITRASAGIVTIRQPPLV
ncbi:MAG TPA: hypothetical protein VK681_29595 [Reyranella sp.]|nr:hypothetical protein [Reyranella sp.]